jgi:hypothetical protein
MQMILRKINNCYQEKSNDKSKEINKINYLLNIIFKIPLKGTLIIINLINNLKLDTEDLA